MKYKLGINTGFAVNRYSEHEVWSQIVGEELGLKYVQLTADMINPDLPATIINKNIQQINHFSKKFNFNIDSLFTGAFTRVNHLAHPDVEVRNHWKNWFFKFVDMAVDLGSPTIGSHFGIFTAKDNRNQSLRAERRKQNIEGWHEIASYAKKKGLQYLTWEPMSISREQGETLTEARKLQEDVNRNSPLPFFMCLDVDHGDVMSPNPDDTDPYKWLSEFANVSPQVHLKQSSKNKGGHWPFTKDKNIEGKIIPQKVLDTFSAHSKNAPFDTTCMMLELSFREREPIDSTVVEVLKESVAFWRTVIKD